MLIWGLREQLAFHNCHIPFVGTPVQRELCQNGTTCTESASSGPLANLTDTQLDFYACLNELDGAVGRVLDAMDRLGYGGNTLTWLATDNGPEKNCQPEGFCDHTHYQTGPGSAVPLRGRKRDVWEGGHRIPSIISWPAVVQGDAGRVSWELVLTADFLPTIMDVLNVSRPSHQADWSVDGRSVLPLLKAPMTAFNKQDRHVYALDKNVLPVHSMGWMFNGWQDPSSANSSSHAAYRYGRWKYVHRSKSCSNPDCEAPMLFDLSRDLGETTDVSKAFPDVFEAIERNFSTWYQSVYTSIVNESRCSHIGPPQPPSPPPPPAPPSNVCTFKPDTALSGGSKISSVQVDSKEACCGFCQETDGCAGAAYHGTFRGHRFQQPTGNCVLRRAPLELKQSGGAYVCVIDKVPADTGSVNAAELYHANWVLGGEGGRT